LLKSLKNDYKLTKNKNLALHSLRAASGRIPRFRHKSPGKLERPSGSILMHPIRELEEVW
jgi:hypothetical protein